MNIKIRLLGVLALALVTFIPRPTAAAVDSFRFKGQNAHAFFSSADECIFTDLSIFAGEGLSRNSPGKGEPTSGVSLFISQYDFCAGTQVLYAEGFAPVADADFQVNGQLESATLNTVVNVYDSVSDSYFDVFIDLSWTALGPMNRENSNFRFHTHGCKVQSRFSGSFRFAEASGTITDGATNFTPEPSWDGLISSVRSGDMFVNCN